MIKKVLFRVDYDNNIGLGHLIRSLNLAKLFAKNRHEITFIVKVKKKIKIKKIKNINFIYLNKNISIKNESKIVLNYFYNENYDKLILDIDHKFQKKRKYECFLQRISSILHKTICWDNIISHKFRFFLTYRPYPSYILLKKLSKNFKVLSGLENMYYPKQKRPNKSNLKNILINLGGTNQNNKILFILKKINSYNTDKKLNIKIANFKNLKSIKQFRNHRISTFKFIKQENLYKEIDLAIVSGGMSKYECMLNMIPFVVINLDKSQVKINSKFNHIYKFIIINKLSELETKLELILSSSVLRNKMVNDCFKMRKKYNEKNLIKNLLRS